VLLSENLSGQPEQVSGGKIRGNEGPAQTGKDGSVGKKNVGFLLDNE
jgi:hypothetical protein